MRTIFALVFIGLLPSVSRAVTADQVWAYLYGAGISDPASYMHPRTFLLASDDGTEDGWIAKWAPGMPAPPPTAADLLPAADASAVRAAAALGQATVVAGVPRPMTPAEIDAAEASAEAARQAAKPATLKAAETALVRFLRAERAVAADASGATADQIDAMVANWEATLNDIQLEKKSTKYDRLLRQVERRGGTELDSFYHE